MGVAGGSGSGKSTICRIIAEHLSPCSVEIVNLDRFFKPEKLMPTYYSNHHQEFRPDFNTPDSLFVDDMLAFCRQEFTSDVVIFDGHFALYYPELRDLMAIKLFIDIDLDEMLNRRTSRNLSIGYGGDQETILAYNLECVVPRHTQYIFPTKQYADFIISNRGIDADLRDRQISIICGTIRQIRLLSNRS